MAKPGPVFIVGCGRSGTTALGRLLGSHPNVTYLNEPRRIWALDPRTDVWTGEGELDLYDADWQTRKRLRRAFASLTERGTVMVEKTPINSFRIDYIRRVFPGARFLHLVRNGLDVARSMEEYRAGGRRWHGRGVKWARLRAYAEKVGMGAQARAVEGDIRLQGLLEWTLAVGHVQPRLGPGDMEIRYEDLAADPPARHRRIVAWVGLPDAPLDATSFRPRRPSLMEIDDDAEAVAGAALRRLGYLPSSAPAWQPPADRAV
jgi:hypothetical protein